jgi:DnaJ-class molecular chaperone
MATQSRIVRFVTEGFYGDAKERNTTCPACEGKGEAREHHGFTTGYFATGKCSRCKGTGKVTEWYWERD